MVKIHFYIPVPNFLALLALSPILIYRKIKYGESYMLIKLTQGRAAKVDASDFLYLRNYKWYAQKNFDTFYARRSFTKNGRKKQISMHREIMNPAEDIIIDHRNQDGLDNRRSNLREATKAENNCNRKKRVKRFSSIYKGVSWNSEHNKWSADIMVNGKKIFLGYFDNEIDAAKAYDAAAKLYHGEFASLNFP